MAASSPSRLATPDDYRHALAELRRLRDSAASAERDRALAAQEAAVADYAERLRASDLEAGRPEPAPPRGSPSRLADAPMEEPSAEDPPPKPERPDS